MDCVNGFAHAIVVLAMSCMFDLPLGDFMSALYFVVLLYSTLFLALSVCYVAKHRVRVSFLFSYYFYSIYNIYFFNR